MSVTARLMTLPETEHVIAYFHGASPEHLEMLGVDPTRLPPADAWRQRLSAEYNRPLEQRAIFLVIWLLIEKFVGFSTADKIVFGERANMHLHVTDAGRRNQGFGSKCVRETIKIYFDVLKLKTLFCEPNAFNTAPNRTLQKAGFRYLKTHLTVPGPLNYHQAVTRWVFEADLSVNEPMPGGQL